MRKLIPIVKNNDTYLTKVKYPLQQNFNTPIEEKFKDKNINNKYYTSKDKIIKDRFNVKNEILILEKKIKDINKRIDKLFEDTYKGLFEDEDFIRVYSVQIQARKDIEERIKQLKELEEKENSAVYINKLEKDFVNMKEITRNMLVSLVDKIEISQDKETIF